MFERFMLCKQENIGSSWNTYFVGAESKLNLFEIANKFFNDIMKLEI